MQYEGSKSDRVPVVGLHDGGAIRLLDAPPAIERRMRQYAGSIAFDPGGRLLADDTALTDFVARHPQSDVQWLRATIRAARRDQADGRPPRHARELYRWLHDCLESALRADET